MLKRLIDNWRRKYKKQITVAVVTAWGAVMFALGWMLARWPRRK